VFVCVFPAIYCALHGYFEFSISEITNTFFSLCSAYILQICTYSFIFIFFRCFFFFGRPVLQLFLMLFCFGFVLACALFRERVSKRERVGFSFFFSTPSAMHTKITTTRRISQWSACFFLPSCSYAIRPHTHTHRQAIITPLLVGSLFVGSALLGRLTLALSLCRCCLGISVVRFGRSSHFTLFSRSVRVAVAVAVAADVTL